MIESRKRETKTRNVSRFEVYMREVRKGATNRSFKDWESRRLRS